MRKFLILSLIFICLTLCACSPKNESEIIGTYLFEDFKEKEVIVLKADRSYMRTLLVKETNQSNQEIGTWKYQMIAGPHVSLEHDNPKDPTKQMVSVEPIENWFGKMYLGMDEDGARLYRKTD